MVAFATELNHLADSKIGGERSLGADRGACCAGLVPGAFLLFQRAHRGVLSGTQCVCGFGGGKVGSQKVKIPSVFSNLLVLYISHEKAFWKGFQLPCVAVHSHLATQSEMSVYISGSMK